MSAKNDIIVVNYYDYLNASNYTKLKSASQSRMVSIRKPSNYSIETSFYYNDNNNNNDNNSESNYQWGLISIQTYHRLQRLVSFLLFFIVFILIIVIMSKIYKNFMTIKSRHKKYGYYLNAKYESYLYDYINQIRSIKKIDIIKKNLRAPLVPVKTIEFNDFGHINEVFEDEVSCESSLLALSSSNSISSLTTCSYVSNETKPKGALSSYIEMKRINSFGYERLKNDDGINTQNKKNRLIKRMYNKWRNNSLPISNQLDMNSATTSFSNLESSKTGRHAKKFKIFGTNSQESFPSPSVSASPISQLSLPIILVTDTSSMETSIIDLDSLDTGVNVLSRENLLRYYLNNKK